MNVTQWLGLISFGIAGLLCLCRGRPVWIAIGSVNLLYGAECAMGWRHDFQNWATAALRSQYSERMPVQIGLIFGVFIFGASLLAIMQLSVRDRLTRVALIGTAISVGLFAIETISLHGVDNALYRDAGPALVIGWAWLGLASITSFAAGYSGFLNLANVKN